MYNESSCQLKSVQAERLPSEIETRLDLASNSVQRLGSRVEALEDRLRPLMRATGATGAGTAPHPTGIPQEALSPLGDSIRSLEQRIEISVERLESVLNGLAL
jgi:hypothetical protein